MTYLTSIKYRSLSSTCYAYPLRHMRQPIYSKDAKAWILDSAKMNRAFKNAMQRIVAGRWNPMYMQTLKELGENNKRHTHKITQSFLFDFLTFPPNPIGLAAAIRCCDSRCFFSSISCPTAVLTASSKTSSTPCVSLLLHSTYTAPMRLATA